MEDEDKKFYFETKVGKIETCAYNINMLTKIGLLDSFNHHLRIKGINNLEEFNDEVKEIIRRRLEKYSLSVDGQILHLVKWKETGEFDRYREEFIKWNTPYIAKKIIQNNKNKKLLI